MSYESVRSLFARVESGRGNRYRKIQTTSEISRGKEEAPRTPIPKEESYSPNLVEGGILGNLYPASCIAPPVCVRPMAYSPPCGFLLVHLQTRW
jgi:hypothetical protein